MRGLYPKIPPVCESWVSKGGELSKVLKPSPQVRNPTDVLVRVSAASINPLGKFQIPFIFLTECIILKV